MSGVTDVALLAAEVLIGASLLMTLAHLLQVRTLLGRIVALEVLAALTVGTAGVITIITGETAAIDVALAVALVSFTGTVAFAAFFEGWRVDE